jgi:hypothetical protein
LNHSGVGNEQRRVSLSRRGGNKDPIPARGVHRSIHAGPLFSVQGELNAEPTAG